MATNKQLKFFKGASAPATPAAGMIWFCTSDRTIRVYTGTDWEKYAGLVDASWNNTDKLLTITSANGNTTTLNLSDMASASGVAAQIQTINTNISNAQNAADAAQADVDAVEEKLGDGFSKDSTVTAQLAAVKTTADAAAVKATVDAALELKADKTQVTADIAAAKSGAEATAAADATSKANQALADAKTYVDGKDTAMDARVDALELAVGTGGAVDDKIEEAIGKLATPEAGETGDGTFVDVTVKQVDGVVTEVSVVENDIASAQALTSEISRATAAEAGLAGRLDTAEGDIDALQEQIQALEGVTHFYGTVSDEAAKDAVTDMKEGDVIVVTGSGKEYIYDGVNWIELGDTTAESGRITTLESWKTEAAQAIADNTAAIKSNDADIKALQEADAAQTTLNATFATKQELATEKNALNALIEANGTAITALQGADTAINGRLDGHDTKIGNLETAVAGKVAQGDFNDLAGKVSTAEADIDDLQAGTGLGEAAAPTYTNANYIAASANMVAADMALDAAIKALDVRVKAEEDKVVVSSVSGDADVNATPTTGAVALSLNKATSVAEGDTKAVTSGAVFNALCWVEFE